jgi:site-specific DNA-cytosine methylase
MNVLSLFDSISCGQVALERAKIKVDKYYASEIEPMAIKVTQHNFPNTIQLGDIRNLNVTDKIDLIIGGSPCQSFSFGGTKTGMITEEKIEITNLEQYLSLKENNFQFNGQSYLF